MTAKTDNHDPRAKLALRRYFLQKYHAEEPPRVLDCCQGGGLMWAQLRKEFPVTNYWGLDLKPKKGRLKLDSVRVLAQPGWNQNVIDIDTYGSPWKHWAQLVKNVQAPATVFLTIGQWQMGVDKTILEAMGLGGLKIPPDIGAKILRFSLSYCLTTGCVNDIIINEVVEAVSHGTARYVGVRLGKAGVSPQRSSTQEN